MAGENARAFFEEGRIPKADFEEFAVGSGGLIELREPLFQMGAAAEKIDAFGAERDGTAPGGEGGIEIAEFVFQAGADDGPPGVAGRVGFGFGEETGDAIALAVGAGEPGGFALEIFVFGELLEEFDVLIGGAG